MEILDDDEEGQILQNIYDEHYSYRRHVNNKVHAELGEHHGFSCFGEIKSFMRAIEKTKEHKLKIEHPIDVLDFNAWPLRKHYVLIRDVIDFYDINVFYDPFIELFFKVYTSIVGYEGLPVDPFEIMPDGVNGMGKFISIIIEIKKGFEDKEFKRRVKRVRDYLRRGEESTTKYVNALFEKYSKLLVLRIDLHLSGEGSDADRLRKIRKFFNRFLNNRRSNKIFRHVVGYVWKLEEGNKRRFHYHLIIFVNGSESQKDVFLCRRIGEYWESITEEKFNYYNVNANKKYLIDKGLGVGIGKIDYHDSEKRRNLLRIVHYFFKAEQYLSSKTLKKMHVFGTGGMPKQNNLGRPRSLTS